MNQQATLNIAIQGMSCGGCAAKLSEMLKTKDGISSVAINFATSTGNLQIDRTKVTQQDVNVWVSEMGYSVEFMQEAQRVSRNDEDSRHEKAQLIAVVVGSLLSFPLLVGMIGMFSGNMAWHVPPGGEWMLATPIQFWLGWRFYKGAWNQAKFGSTNMDTLVAIGTSAAYFYSVYLVLSLGEQAKGHLYFEASALVITLVSLGKYLELRAKRSATSAIEELMNLRPSSATVWREERWLRVPTEEIYIGNKVLIKAGEKIPADGRVVRGQTEVDEALLTGESAPVIKQVNDSVSAGSINTTGVIEVEVTVLATESQLAKIIELVENAQMGKAPFLQLVDRISCIFVPIVLVIATITFGAWLWLTGDFEAALVSAVTVLVIACPCALGLATPAALVADNIQVFAGEGLVGQYQGKQVALGNDLLLSRYHLDVSFVRGQAQAHIEAGHSISYLVIDGVIEAVLAFTDPIKPSAKATIDALNKQGISCSILSGDQSMAVMKVASRLNVNMAYGELSPRDKLEKLAMLKRQYPQGVAMVGDGINDAPALAAADISIAMGSGTDVAMETANITLMASQPERITDAVSISKNTWVKIKQNLCWAFALTP
ncbi:heavy metal translocating P-type ATPase [Vibrio paucivorans]